MSKLGQLLRQSTDSVHESELFVEHGYEFVLTDLEEKLNTNIDSGLADDKIKERLEIFGHNRIVTPKPSLWKLYLAPLFDTLIVIYLIMTGIMLILSIFVPDIRSKVTFWLVMIGFNMVLAIFQQFRAQKKIEALQQLSPPLAMVMRDGEKKEIEAVHLVPGDIVELSLGDRIPADMRIIESSNLTINEASLTGESMPATKARDGSDALDLHAPISERTNFLYLGTFVQTGTTKAIVVRTGNDTELGKIASAMADISIEIPLRKRVNALGKWLGFTMIVFLLILISFVVNKRLKSDESYTTTLFAGDLAQAIINAMAVLPINIPLLTTVILITGVLNMATNRVVIKELSVVETLGRCSVLCSDKTGTMTTSRMTVKLLFDTEKYYSVTLSSNLGNNLTEIDESMVHQVLETQPDLTDDAIESIAPNSSLDLLMTTAILNNEANIVSLSQEERDEDKEWEIVGNPTDGALLVLAMTNGLKIDIFKHRYLRERSYPFDSTVKRMSGLFEDTLEDDHMVFCKGATEVILPLCTKIGNELNLKELTDEKRSEIQAKVDSFANDGYRVISLAYKPVDHIPDLEDAVEERKIVESDLQYIGFAIIYDPPRPGVKNAVKDLDAAGIFPIMITGDSITTAATIAKQVGILDPDEMVVEGKEAETLSDEHFFKVSVFARVSPQDKEIIVHRYQSRGDVVAMTGDGVNDALAITKSDAGVAMGITGTEVAKEAADIIITDDSYVSLVKGVEEGRNLYEKIRMLIFFYIAVNFAEAVIYFTVSFQIDFQILNNWQRVYIFSIIHAIPVLGIIFGPPDKNIMKLKPRDNDGLLSRRLVTGLVIYSITLAVSILSVYFFIYYGNADSVSSFNMGGIGERLLNNFRDPDSADLSNQLLAEDFAHAKARTILLSTLYIAESFLVLSIRRINSSIIDSSRNDISARVWIMVLFGPIMHFMIMYVNTVQNFLYDAGLEVEIIRLGFEDLLVVFSVALFPLFLLELFKKYNRSKNIQL